MDNYLIVLFLATAVIGFYILRSLLAYFASRQKLFYEAKPPDVELKGLPKFDEEGNFEPLFAFGRAKDIEDIQQLLRDFRDSNHVLCTAMNDDYAHDDMAECIWVCTLILRRIRGWKRVIDRDDDHPLPSGHDGRRNADNLGFLLSAKYDEKLCVSGEDKQDWFTGFAVNEENHPSMRLRISTTSDYQCYKHNLTWEYIDSLITSLNMYKPSHEHCACEEVDKIIDKLGEFKDA